MSANTLKRNMELAKVRFEGLVANKPTLASTGYPKGCEYVTTDGATVGTVKYVNIGDETSCNFVAGSGLS